MNFTTTYLSVLTMVLWSITGCSTEGDKSDPVVPPPPDKPVNSRITGDTTDVTTITTGGTCLMGGGADVDAAFRWMIGKSGGGDFVVIRFDDSFGYNSYIYRMKGINSVETIVISSTTDANNPIISAKIRNAEALFIAGGDQKRYVTLWKDTPVEDAINYLINSKYVPIGGTSAGCAILGSSYFAALKGSVSSSEALGNPYHSRVTLGHDDFINNPFLQNTITDQHYSQRSREGRLVAFMARMNQDLNKNPHGIAVDEETAVCIDEHGIATVFGRNNAFFLQRTSSGPETCLPDNLLTWDQGQQAIKVYRITGSSDGNGAFNLVDFSTVLGGTWFYYYVINGVFYSL